MHDLTRLGAWADLPFFTTDLPAIEAALAKETRPILPPAPDRFRALELTQPDAVRVILLGQDPYPTPGHAHGLAFSVAEGTPLPRSLTNIFNELRDDLQAHRTAGDLTDWAAQGVLLLNTALTVPAHNAGAHAKLGWAHLTAQVLTRLNDIPRAALLWGRHAQGLRKHLTNPGHFILETAHPSPLSASRGFFGSRPFSKINAWLTTQNLTPINWA
ncbi:MAG: uracil-DNA glycosylase [Pseudomonadota bacterium]